MCIIKPSAYLWEQTVHLSWQTCFYIFHYEYLYMKNLLRDNLCMAKQFSNTVRYIDDLLTLNNSHFEEEITNIYPSELTLKRTGSTNCPTWIFQLVYVVVNMLLRSMTKEMPLILT